MNIEKVREALAYYARVPQSATDKPQTYGEKLALEALAELSKPSEDAKEVATVFYDEYIGQYNGESENYIIGGLAGAFQQFAIDYHAKQCAECTQKYWATAPKSYPLTEPPEVNT